MFGQSKFGQNKFGQGDVGVYEKPIDLWVIQCKEQDNWSVLVKKAADLQKCEGDTDVS